MQVLWWLVPPLLATLLAMLWVGWAGWHSDVRDQQANRDSSDEALERMQQALARPTPRKGTPVQSAPIEATHGVAIRRAAERPTSLSDAPR